MPTYDLEVGVYLHVEGVRLATLNFEHGCFNAVDVVGNAPTCEKHQYMRTSRYEPSLRR